MVHDEGFQDSAKMVRHGDLPPEKAINGCEDKPAWLAEREVNLRWLAE
jgi:hypothetical protein